MTATQAAPSGTAQAIEDAAGAEWDDFVSSHSESTVYHRYAWRGVIRHAFGSDTRYFMVRDDHGSVQGILPLVVQRSAAFGCYGISLPFVNYGGALVAPGCEHLHRVLFDAAVDHVSAVGGSHVELRHQTAVLLSPHVRQDKVTMILDLPADPDELFRAFGAKIRSQIRRPEREGAAATVGGVELTNDFYSVFSRNMRDLGTPVYSMRFFEDIATTFADACRIVVVKLDEKPVAAGMLLDHGDRMEIPWASSLREFNRFGVNMMMYWEAMKDSILRGSREFDFGRCSKGTGTHRFKAQWGAQQRQLHWYYWLREGQQMPAINHDNPRYGLAIRAWQHLPVPLANALGPYLARNLP